MTKDSNLTPAQWEESARTLRKRSLLEVLRYHSLINELEECLIINNRLYVLKTHEELLEYPELLSYANLTPSLLTTDEKSMFYFHLEGVGIELWSEYTMKTAEDNMHGRIQLTVLYK